MPAAGLQLAWMRSPQAHAGRPSLLQQPRAAAPLLRRHRCCRCRRAGAARHVVAAASNRDPYELLGIPRSATPADIKKAFRKRALKLHPDVNKAPDARERFMEAKQAYQQLLDEREGRGSSTRGSSSSSSSSSGRGSAAGGAAGGAGSWGARSSTSSSGQSSYGGQQRQWQPPEPDYSFGDLLRDLDKELSDYARERKSKRTPSSASSSSSSAAPGGLPKSLWEELYDIGEEFVDFLEQNLGVSDEEASSYSNLKKKYGDLSGTSDTDTGSGSSGSSSSSSARTGGSAPGGRTMSSAFDGSRAGGAAGGSSGARSSGGGAAAGRPPLERKSTAEIVEDELAALKRKMGKK